MRPASFMSRQRKIYFHEDDYCEQQLLPRAAAEFAAAEIKKIAAFAEAHRTPDGYGWTDVYVRQEAPAELRALNVDKKEFDSIMCAVMPPFDLVYTGHAAHWERRKKTAAWGKAERCALFAEWDAEGIVRNIWTEFFERDQASILAATKAVAALGKLHPLVYVDWAWGYICDISDEDDFASRLRAKLDIIGEKRKPSK